MCLLLRLTDLRGSYESVLSGASCVRSPGIDRSQSLRSSGLQPSLYISIDMKTCTDSSNVPMGISILTLNLC